MVKQTNHQPFESCFINTNQLLRTYSFAHFPWMTQIKAFWSLILFASPNSLSQSPNYGRVWMEALGCLASVGGWYHDQFRLVFSVQEATKLLVTISWVVSWSQLPFISYREAQRCSLSVCHWICIDDDCMIYAWAPCSTIGISPPIRKPGHF